PVTADKFRIYRHQRAVLTENDLTFSHAVLLSKISSGDSTRWLPASRTFKTLKARARLVR
ncbi:MAG: hypothetical protein ACN4GW_10390, partial [Desulforhopalus sp.]